MEYKYTQKVRDLKMDQVLYIDLETTDKIDYQTKMLPAIIEFSVYYGHDKRFRSMITPDDPEFEIHPEATKIHGWTRRSLLQLPS